MTDVGSLASRHIAEVVLGDEPLDSVLDVVCYDARSEIPHANEVSVTVKGARGFRTAAHTNERVRQADELQYELAEGPCLDSTRDVVIYEIGTMSREQRWPRYTPRASEIGIGSSLSLPLVAADVAVGALNVYSWSEEAFDDEDRRAAEEFARRAAVLLAGATAFAAQEEVAEQLRQAIATREVIGKAIGILMEREGIDDEQAFGMLRTASQNSNVKLRDIAEELVRRARASRPGG